MREYPFFVPFQDDHLAAVVSLPEGDPAGLVVLMTGTGPRRVIGNMLWAQAAEELARRRLATVRFDFRGMGDSTGEIEERRLFAPSGPREQAARVLDHALLACGVEGFVVVGHCLGAQAAIELARDRRCLGLAVSALPLEPPRSFDGLTKKIRKRGFFGRARASPTIRRIYRVGKRALAGSGELGLVGTVAERARTTQVLVLYTLDGRGHGYQYHPGIPKLVERARRGLPAEARERLELLLLRVEPRVVGLEVIPERNKQLFLTPLLEWTAGVFAAEPAPSREPERAHA